MMNKRACIAAAAGALLLAACDQPLTTAANPHPQVTPPRQTNEQIARETLSRLVTLERESGGAAFAAEKQAAITKLDASAATPSGAVEVARLNDVLARLRAISAAQDGSRQ